MKTKSDGLKGIKRIPLFPSFGTPARTWRRMARMKEGRKVVMASASDATAVAVVNIFI